jgi:hypothetical protein
MKSMLRRAYRAFFGPLIYKFDQIESRVDHNRRLIERLQSEVELNRTLLNLVELNCVLTAQLRLREFGRMPSLHDIAEAEFRVFSQWGEDGIIQYLLSKVPIVNRVFVEFGVEDYHESNTRFVLVNNNWSGLVIDCDEDCVAKIRQPDLYWRYDLTALCAFVNRDNVNQLIEEAGISDDIGLLSIDVDGNDYWIWEAIAVVSPRIVIVEYNSLFGSRHAVTIPYDANFNRTRAHYSGLYFGASLPAMCRLARQKGYVFAGSNSAGCNAFFVRQDVASNIVESDCESGYVKSKFREARNEAGRLTFISDKDRIELIKDEAVLDLESGQIIRIRDILLQE